ncbi:hypothetical protein [Streptantibioticus silvisoli]|uniref:CYTH domain-containing protein n=1 Tax=Streptantibioticus silvisoli TaxID=2705255 RepID=A0ABT6VUM5_9ACTN|nr:hypothetical protein [Streptantibioticus silvisoli]MDI5962173.1 hypothetical protein [Streptantibioticus silvisoli]
MTVSARTHALEEAFRRAAAEPGPAGGSPGPGGFVLTRWNPDFEYEIKLAHPGPVSPAALLEEAVTVLAAGAGVLAGSGRQAATLRPVYHLAGGSEYSVFEEDGRRVQKIKTHTAVPVGGGRGVHVMRSRESFETDPRRIARNTASAVPSGSLLKERCRTHLLHRPTRTLLQLAATRCSAGTARQFQLEIEYAGHFTHPADPPRTPGEQEVLAVLAGLGTALADADGSRLAFDTETKLEFLRRASGGTATCP